MRDIRLLIAADGQWYRYWPDFTPALISEPLGMEEPFADLKVLAAVTPRLTQPRPKGETYQTASVLICGECDGSGEVEDADPEPSWEIDEQGKPYLEPPPPHMTRPCPSCGGDGLWKVTWSNVPAASLFPVKE